jgi:hypothetical protein
VTYDIRRASPIELTSNLLRGSVSARTDASQNAGDDKLENINFLEKYVGSMIFKGKKVGEEPECKTERSKDDETGLKIS